MHTVVCPSGFAGEVRGLKVREEKLLTDRSLAVSGRLVGELLSACWLRTTDPGPYRIDGEAAPDWRGVLQGDRFAALLAIRVATYGPEYAFETKCQSCGARIRWRVNLVEDLATRPLSPEDLEAFRAGNRLEVEIGGATVVFRIPTGEDEERLAKLAKAAIDSPISSALRVRIVEARGISGRLDDWLRDLDLGEASRLGEAFERHNCGIDTTVRDVGCGRCGEEQDVELPFDRDFWFPRAP